MGDHGQATTNIPFMAVAALSTALFWGVYGPLLSAGHMAMKEKTADGTLIDHGRMRPFICVGIAYLVVAVIGPILLIQFGLMDAQKGIFDMSSWTISGIWWSFVAGAAGAMGALFLLIALAYAPTKPSPALYVMPLVFGCAPVVNTLYTMWSKNSWNINPFFAAGLILVGVGAVTVLISANFAPQAKAEEKKPAVTKPALEKETPEAEGESAGEKAAEEKVEK